MHADSPPASTADVVGRPRAADAGAPVPRGTPGAPHGRPVPMRAGRPTRCAPSNPLDDVLDEDLGIVPSPRLRRLEEQILLQDPDLDAPPDRNDPGGERSLGREPVPRAARVPRGRSCALLRSGPAGRATRRTRRSTAPISPRRRSERLGQVERRAGRTDPAAAPRPPDIAIALMQPGAQPFGAWTLHSGSTGIDRDSVVASSSSGDPDGLRRCASDRCSDGRHPALLLVVDQFEELFTMVEHAEARASSTLLVEHAADRSSRSTCSSRCGPTSTTGHSADPHRSAVRRERRERRGARPRPARGGSDPPGSPARHHRRAAPRRPPDRRRGRPTERAAAVPVRAHRAVRCAERAACSTSQPTSASAACARPIARRAESLYSQLRPAEQETARQLFLRIATVSGDIVGRRRVPASELVSLDVDVIALRDRDRRVRRATDSSRSIVTRRPAARRSRSPTRRCSPSGTGCAIGSISTETTSPSRHRSSWP